MLRRAIVRHTYMHDEPAYRTLLEHARSLGSVWMVSQSQVAQWWRARDEAQLELSFSAPGRLTISSGLDHSVLQVDSGDLHPLPFSFDVSMDAVSQVRIGANFPSHLLSFLQETLKHLGYGHLHLDTTTPPSPALSASLTRLYDHALQHQRYDHEPLQVIQSHIVQAHELASLPDLRLWNWPHQDGNPFRMALSVRYDVDKAIVNLPHIHRIESEFGLRSTVYLRPVGYFYGAREIESYRNLALPHEIALHGEFLSTSEQKHVSPLEAARHEKRRLEDLIVHEVRGVCMHGGELRSNTTPETPQLIDTVGFDYDTLFRNRYYLPLFIPTENGIRSTLSIGQHFADISIPGTSSFTDDLAKAFESHCDATFKQGGVFVPVMHPLYFGISKYLKHPTNLWRISAFLPRYARMTLRLGKGQSYINQ